MADDKILESLAEKSVLEDEKKKKKTKKKSSLNKAKDGTSKKKTKTKTRKSSITNEERLGEKVGETRIPTVTRVSSTSLPSPTPKSPTRPKSDESLMPKATLIDMTGSLVPITPKSDNMKSSDPSLTKQTKARNESASQPPPYSSHHSYESVKPHSLYSGFPSGLPSGLPAGL